MSQEKKIKASTHKIEHEYSGRAHFYKVTSGTTGKEYNPFIQVGCDCKFMGSEGVANGMICSHVLKMLMEIVETGDVRLNFGKETSINFKRNVCRNLVRPGNRILNRMRSSTSESPEHIAKKEEVCSKLEKLGHHYIAEAIFTTGGRADVLDLDTFTAIEVVKTESEESIAIKRINYPEGIKIKVVRC